MSGMCDEFIKPLGPTIARQARSAHSRREDQVKGPVEAEDCRSAPVSYTRQIKGPELVAPRSPERFG